MRLDGKYEASALLRCPKCGKAYWRSKVCYNRQQGASWSAWMRKNYKGVCPECYKASKIDTRT